MEFGPVTTTHMGSVRLRELAPGVSTASPRLRVDTPAIYIDTPAADLSPPAYDKGGRAIGGEIRPVLILGVGEDREAVEASARADLARPHKPALEPKVYESGPAPIAVASDEAAPSAEEAAEGAREAPVEAAAASETSAETDAKAQTEDEEKSGDPVRPRGADGEPLSEAEINQLDELQARDREVRSHEQAHKTVGGQHAGAISYDYERGPDGRSYAVGGEVQIDISEVPDDPEATIRKMQQVRRAALAPAEPSSQDRAVAAEASEIEQRARTDLRELQTEERQALEESRETSSEDSALALESSDEAKTDDAKAWRSYEGRVRVDLQVSEALYRQRGIFAYLQGV